MGSLLKAILIIGDLALLNLSILLSLVISGNFHENGISVDSVYLLIFSNLCWIFLVLISSPYNITKGWAISKIVKNQIAFFFIHILVVASLAILFRLNYSVLQLGLIYVIFLPVFFLVRVISLYVRKLSTPKGTKTRYVLVGRNELSSEVRKYFLMNQEAGYKFQGYLEPSTTISLVSQLQAITETKDVQEVYCCVADQENGQELKDLINFGLDSLIKVKLMVKSDQQALRLDRFDQMPGVGVASVPLDTPFNQIVKRLFDVASSVMFNLLVMSWLVPIVGLIIKLDSPGPIFFGQMRNGEKNEPFRCLKFRTMLVNDEAETKQATKEDSRITRVGKFLRKSSIDELPQFINVMLGNMSLIGPRPHPIKLNEKFATEITNIMSRHYVKPGITGLAQCMGYRGETSNLSDMENRIRLDRYYIENWTFWLDIKIIFLTVVSLIRGSDKAY